MDGWLDLEQALGLFFVDFAVAHVEAGWSLPEVDAAVRFMRARFAGGEPLGDALIAAYDLQRTGKLVPEDPEC